jgi:hypothetical protein
MRRPRRSRRKCTWLSWSRTPSRSCTRPNPVRLRRVSDKPRHRPCRDMSPSPSPRSRRQPDHRPGRQEDRRTPWGTAQSRRWSRTRSPSRCTSPEPFAPWRDRSTADEIDMTSTKRTPCSAPPSRGSANRSARSVGFFSAATAIAEATSVPPIERSTIATSRSRPKYAPRTRLPSYGKNGKRPTTPQPQAKSTAVASHAGCELRSQQGMLAARTRLASGPARRTTAALPSSSFALASGYRRETGRLPGVARQPHLTRAPNLGIGTRRAPSPLSGSCAQTTIVRACAVRAPWGRGRSGRLADSARRGRRQGTAAPGSGSTVGSR